MFKMIHTAVIEANFYARNAISLLLARDWRTRVVFEAGSLTPLLSRLEAVAKNRRGTPPLSLNAILVNEQLLQTNQVTALRHLLAETGQKPVLLAIGREFSPNLARSLAQADFTGLLVDEEISYSLGWALALAQAGQRVITPGVQADLTEAIGGCLLLDGRNPVISLSAEDQELARLAVIFSMERRDMADEAGISTDWSYGKASEFYERSGINAVLDGSVPLADFANGNATVLSHLEAIRASALSPVTSKRQGLEKLAFHLITLPSVTAL
jgi:hypothetical protein